MGEKVVHQLADAGLLDSFGDLPAPIPEIVRQGGASAGRWVTHDIPTLPVWHHGPICLLGDAAHATSPHAGQGASMAIEDAVVLGRSLRDWPNLEDAFATFQRIRRDRVEAVVKGARRAGNQKAIANPLMIKVRDVLLPFFLKLGERQANAVYAHRIEWDAVAV